MGRRGYLAIFVIIVAAAGAGGYWYWQQGEAAALAAQAAIRQEVVGRGNMVATVSGTGFLEPQQQADLYFAAPSAGLVVEVSAEVGQAVHQGDVLARLDDSALQLAVSEAEQSLSAARLTLALLQAPPRPEDIAVAEANVRVAKNQVYSASQGQSADQVEIARLNLLLAQNRLNQTYATMDRLVEQNRWAEKNALQAQADNLVEAAQVADLRYHQAQAPAVYGPIAQAQAGVEQAEANLARLLAGTALEDIEIARRRIGQAQAALELAQYNLSGTVIVAPFDGLVASANLRVGEPAGGLPAFTLVDASRFYLDVAVDEVDIASIVAGQAVTVTLDALPDLVLPAEVERIAPVAAINAGVVSYPVRLRLAATDTPLRAGMTATGAIVVREVRDVVLVPNWAILRNRETGQAYVGRLRDGIITDVPVTLGLRDEAYSEVTSGIQAGDVAAVDTARQTFSLFGGGQ